MKPHVNQHSYIRRKKSRLVSLIEILGSYEQLLTDSNQ